MDFVVGEAGLHLSPGPVGLVNTNSTKQSGGYNGAGDQPGIQPQIFFYHNYLNISYEDQVVKYHKQQHSSVGLTKLT